MPPAPGRMPSPTWLPKYGTFPGHAEIAGHGQLAAAAQRHAVYRGDDGQADTFNEFIDLLPCSAVRAAVIGVASAICLTASRPR